jgi:peptidoglycan/xylan/chitin deacetylase (PgdA/CDA1 family)
VSPFDLNLLGDDGASAAAPGPDHGWFPWGSPETRLPVRWPNGATVAVAIVLDLGAVEWEGPGHEPAVPPVGGRGVAAWPDVPRMSHREFGHRVGIFRLLEILGELDITPAAVVDVLTVEHYPGLLDLLVPNTGELIAGGISASRPLSSLMDEDEERHYIGMTLERLAAALGERPAGWRSPEHSESARTPELLAESGLRYVTDWCNDEQPYPMCGSADGLWTFPLSWELSDVAAVLQREVSPVAYGRSVREAFDVLCGEGDRTGRVLGLHLHPWLSGQAFRASPIEDALRHIGADGRAWIATPAEIVSWCRRSTALPVAARSPGPRTTS